MNPLPSEPHEPAGIGDTKRLLQEWRDCVRQAVRAKTPQEVEARLEQCRRAYKAWELALITTVRISAERRRVPRTSKLRKEES